MRARPEVGMGELFRFMKKKRKFPRGDDLFYFIFMVSCVPRLSDLVKHACPSLISEHFLFYFVLICVCMPRLPAGRRKPAGCLVVCGLHCSQHRTNTKGMYLYIYPSIYLCVFACNSIGASWNT